MEQAKAIEPTATEPDARHLDMGDGFVLTLFPVEPAPFVETKKPQPRQAKQPRKLTARRVRELLDCDPETGTLTWRERPDAPQRWNTRYAGKPTGISIDSGGYASLQIDKRRYLTHRIVWLHTKGWLPKQDLDHRDGNRTNNAIENLRLATVSQNNANQVRTSRKGFPRGCQQDPKTGNWNVKIKAQGKVVYIGSFSEREVAARAYLDAAELLHGQFSVAERPRPEAVEIAT